MKRRLAWLVCASMLSGGAMAQVPPGAAAGAPAPAPGTATTTATAAAAAAAPPAGATPAAPSAATGARFIASCQQALERGVAELGCQGPIYRNELERLKREALTTQNPQLLSFVGDAYGSQRSGVGDIGQAYRWYLLAAVRGDPRAMQRLAEMNRRGEGTPKDNVKALGYARLVERMSQPDTGEHRNVVTLINELGAEMAVEEVALAERFAAELEGRVERQAAGQSAPDSAARQGAAADPTRPGVRLPGMVGVPSGGSSPPAPRTPLPGSVLPGVPPAAPPR